MSYIFYDRNLVKNVNLVYTSCVSELCGFFHSVLFIYYRKFKGLSIFFNIMLLLEFYKLKINNSIFAQTGLGQHISKIV